MKIKHAICAIATLLTLGTMDIVAQETTALKEFTLEDLNFGGTNYRNMIPGNRWLTWWGDQLVRLDVEECYLVDKKTGKETLFLTVADINKWLGCTAENGLRALYNARFPYADQPLVLLSFGGKRQIIDFEQKKVAWSQSNVNEHQASNFNTASRHTAYVSGDQLYVRSADADKEEVQLTTDGSREIVYGRSVHRDEFGIHSGLFWSPDGMKLAFYRMDQSMVTDYPQVNLFTHIAINEPDKYPMAGQTSHEVTVGVYDVSSDKTIYLKTDNYKDLSGEMRLNFEVGKATLNVQDAANVQVLDEARGVLREVFGSAMLRSFEVVAYSSPEGNAQTNEDLARRRASFVLNELKAAIPSSMHSAIRPVRSEILGWDVVADSLESDGRTDIAQLVREIVAKHPGNLVSQGQAIARLDSYATIIKPVYLPKLRTVRYTCRGVEDRYFTNVAWSPDAKTIYIFELNRDQNDCRLVSYDATTGERIAEIYRETDEKYVEPQNPIVFLPWDEGKFIMQSQKDGYNHLYLFDKSGKELRQLTKGEWVVLGLVGFDTKSKSVIIISSECNPIQCNTWAVSVATGKRTLLDNGEGWHSPSLSGSGRYIADSYQTPTVPRNIEIVDAKTRKRTVYYESPNPWEGYKVPEFSCGSIKAADGTTDLYWRMVKPADFDETKKYPTIVYVYGGPHAHLVDARWNYSSRSWETYMAQKGYITFILDNRGSENRGKAFEQATFRELGQQEMLDQMCGVEYLKSLPYVDADRIGVHGWSFGGFMTISLMTNYPDVFKVGVSGGPVIDWKWYEVMYGERYMDTPEANPEGYAKTSLLPKARELRGKLQIITGYNDPTVVPQHCLMFIEECIKAGTQPDFFAYPGEGHNMMGHKSVHLHERITQYFEDYLK